VVMLSLMSVGTVTVLYLTLMIALKNVKVYLMGAVCVLEKEQN
jgi:hypothetical protein